MKNMWGHFIVLSLVVLSLVVLGLVMLLVGSVSAAEVGEGLLERVQLLTAPEYAGRGNGSPELRAIGDTLVAWLTSAQLEPGFGDSWTQEFPLREMAVGVDSVGRNIAGFWPGQGDLAAQTILVSAHYDHLGRLDPHSSGPPAADSFFPGANDNASGVSVVVDLVRDLVAQEGEDGNRRSVLFVFFSGEEIGLQGSAYFVEQRGARLADIDLVLNFDTVGVISDDQLFLSGLGSAEPFDNLVAAADGVDLKLATTQKIWSGSDHMSFVHQNIPSLFVFGGPYANYNRPTDTWQNIEADDLARVAVFAKSLLRNLITFEEPLVWREGFTVSPARASTGNENRDTWFGSLPDFGAEEAGYALAGVFAGSPAEQAGLGKGDVLVEMAGETVTGLVDFTRILRAHQPGELIEVMVKRDKTMMRFSVILGNRKQRP